jgi:hypothetical protein
MSLEEILLDTGRQTDLGQAFSVVSDLPVCEIDGFYIVYIIANGCSFV